MVDAVPGHQLLRLRRVRIRLVGEVCGLRLGQQCAYPIKQALIEPARSRGRAGGLNASGTGHRARRLDRRHRKDHLQYVENGIDGRRPICSVSFAPDRLAAMTCRVQSTDGSLQWTCSRKLVTPWSEVCRNLLLDRAFKNSDFFNPEPDVHWDRSDTRPVECLLGAFMLIRREAITALGGLDERFFLMYEDADWCKRAHLAGWKLMFWPGAHIVHIGGGFWKQEPVLTFANSYVSAISYFEKHHPRALPWVRLASRVGMNLKIGLLKINALRKPNDAYTVKHLAMARAAKQTLLSGKAIEYGNWAKASAEATAKAAANTASANAPG